MRTTTETREGPCIHCGGSFHVYYGVCEDCAVAMDLGPQEFVPDLAVAS